MSFTRVNGYLAFSSNPSVNGQINFNSNSLDTGLTFSSSTLTIDGATYPGLYLIDFTAAVSTASTACYFYFYVTSPAIYYPGGSGTNYFPFGKTILYTPFAITSGTGGVAIQCSSSTQIKFYTSNTVTFDYTYTRVNITRVPSDISFTKVNGYLAFSSNYTTSAGVISTFSSTSLDTGLSFSSGVLTIDGANYPGLYLISFTLAITSGGPGSFYFYVTSPAIYYPGGSGTNYLPFGNTDFNNSLQETSGTGNAVIVCTSSTQISFYTSTSFTLDYTSSRIDISRMSL